MRVTAKRNIPNVEDATRREMVYKIDWAVNRQWRDGGLQSLDVALMLGADKPSDESIEKFCRIHEWVLPSPDGLLEIADFPSAFSGIADLRSALSEVRPRGPLSYLTCKQSVGC